MTLANLLNIPNTPEEWAYFSFNNQDAHHQIFGALLNQGVRLSDYVLDPITPDSAATWLRIHQQAHTEFNSALGIQGNDLSTVDFKNPTEVAAWVQLHWSEHQQATVKLGVQ